MSVTSPWATVRDWPEQLDDMPFDSEIGRLRSQASNLATQAASRHGEAGRMTTRAEEHEAVVRDATISTRWETVAKSATMAPIFRREAERLEAEAAAMDSERARLNERIQQLWGEYRATLARWKKTPTHELSDELACLTGMN